MPRRGNRQPYEVKTSLAEPHYNAMLDMCEAFGMTQAGYVRQLILRDIIQSQVLVEQMAEIADRPKRSKKRR